MSFYDTKERYSLLEKHPEWLDRLEHTCQFSGKIVGKKVKGKYKRYAFHHTSTDAYDHEIPGYNYILLTRRAHWLVHALGGILFLRKGAISIQNKRAKNLPLSSLWEYPNPPQRLFHFWCRVPGAVRLTMLLAMLVYVSKVYLSN